MEKKNACCGDKKIFIKAEKDQKRTQTDIEFSNSVSEIDNHNARFPEIKVAVGAFIHPSISAHPIINTIPLFILNRVFRL